MATLVAAVLAPLISAALAWGVGSVITDRWDEMKRRRDLDLAAVSEFYDSYGEYVDVWRLWSACKRYEVTAHPPEGTQWLLLTRASAAESRIEALLIRCATERLLSRDQQEQLACFREASQQLRESIRKDSNLNWFTSGPEDSREYRGYQAFKDLSASFAYMLQQPRPKVSLLRGRTMAGLPTVEESRIAWRFVSSGDRKNRWLERAESCLNQEVRSQNVELERVNAMPV